MAPVLKALENVALNARSAVEYNHQRNRITYQTIVIKKKADILARYRWSSAHCTCLTQSHRITWPTSKGSTTLSPSCIETSAYMRPSVLTEAGRHASNSGCGGRNAYIKPGQIKAPRVLPITTSTMAAASSPPAALVMTTLEAIVVGRQLSTTIPTKTLVSIACDWRSPAAMTMRMTTGVLSADDSVHRRVSREADLALSRE